MKRILLLSILAISSLASIAQTSNIPNYLNLVAVVRDNTGNPVTSQVDVKLEIATGALFQGGTLRYCEQVQNIQPNIKGEIAVKYGYPVGTNNNLLCTTGTTNSLTDGQWENGNTYYRLSWRITGQPNYTGIDSGFFASVPYAFASRTAEKLVGAQGAQTGEVLKWNGTAWAPGQDLTGGGGGSYSEGAGIDITNSVISATDVSATNEIQTLSLNGSTLNLSNGGGSVALPSGTSPWADYRIVQEQKSFGVNNGAGFNNTTGTRDLNATVASAGSAITFSAPPAITITQTGKYYIKASASVVGVDQTQLFITDATASHNLLLKGIAQRVTGSSNEASVTVEGVLDITTVPYSINVRQYTQSNGVSYGLGQAVGAGGPEIYSQCLIQKIQ